MTTAKITLVAAIEAVELELRSLDAVGGYNPARGQCYDEWSREHQSATSLATRYLVDRTAKISGDSLNIRFRMAGITATSTMGLHGALRNWLKSARTKESAS